MMNIRKLIRDNRGFLLFLVGFGLFRTAIADYNPVPSGSMHPNILEGDVVLVDRLAYQLKVPLTDIVLARLGEPQRGDIVTFSSPRDGTRLIKRIIGLPGDIVAMRDKRLIINGQPAHYAASAGAADDTSTRQIVEELNGERHPIQWLDQHANAADFGPVAIPVDRYLMLGDNRDNSADSRYIGLVAREQLIGRATRILVSANIEDRWQPRFGRFGKSLMD